jgi:hypothetical protein
MEGGRVRLWVVSVALLAAGSVRGEDMEVRLRESVARLAYVRHRSAPAGLERARGWIREAMGAAGWAVAAEEFVEDGVRGVNLRARRAGSGSAPRVWVIGAHYDTTARTPGADDNASGVAGVVELARRWTGTRFRDEVQLVAFDLEEGLHGGSEVLARRMKKDGVAVAGMLSLEMLGWKSERAGSQKAPDAVRKAYPELEKALAARKHRGDFLAAIGNRAAEPVVKALARAAPGLMLPMVLDDAGTRMGALRRSDHAPFWDAGFAALVVTDTADMRSGRYHTMRDVPEALDYGFMAAGVEAVARAVEELAGRQ